MLNAAHIPLSLYVHIPWCLRKCPYCDFNSHEGQFDEAAYSRALLQDLAHDITQVLDTPRPISSIFFGGGTPSLFSAESIDGILSGVREQLTLSDNCEITLEANPGAIEQQRFEGYREAGVNRLSIGIQSFEQAKLQKLGRIHNPQEALAAAATARQAGFNNFNLDLMFALPSQTVEQALADIEQALALKPQHISHYHLTLEPNTYFAKHPPKALPSDDLAWDIQAACHQRLLAEGYHNYEISAWAKPQSQCQHNLNYWQFGDYLGIGAGAHGKITTANGQIMRSSKKKAPKNYLNDINNGPNTQRYHAVGRQDIAFEYFLNRLRLDSSFSNAEASARTGLSQASINSLLQTAAAKGFLQTGPLGWQKTDLGQQHLNELLTLFIPDPS